MARIYIETTIVSFYYEVRTEPEMVARRNWTRRWFDAAKAGGDDLVTSLAVEAELEAGDFPGKADALKLIADLPLVDLNASVAEAVDAYISHRVMPNDPTGDALHHILRPHRFTVAISWSLGIAAILPTRTSFCIFAELTIYWDWAIPHW